MPGTGNRFQQQRQCQLRKIQQVQQIQTRPSGDPNLFENIPEKPPRMHWRTYERLRARGLAAEGQSGALIRGFVSRLRRAL